MFDLGNFFFFNVLEARKCLQSWNSIDILPFTTINILHSLPVSMSVFLYIQMSPKPPTKKLNYLPSLLQKMIGPHTPFFFEPHPKKRVFFWYWCLYLHWSRESLSPYGGFLIVTLYKNLYFLFVYPIQFDG